MDLRLMGAPTSESLESCKLAFALLSHQNARSSYLRTSETYMLELRRRGSLGF